MLACTIYIKRKELLMAEHIKDLAEKFVTLWDKGKVEYIDQIFSSNVNYTFDTSFNQGKDSIREHVKTRESIFKNPHFNIEELIITDTRAVLRWSGQGIFASAYEGIEATNKPFNYKGITILGIENGKISDVWVYTDLVEVLRQQQEKNPHKAV